MPREDEDGVPMMTIAEYEALHIIRAYSHLGEAWYRDSILAAIKNDYVDQVTFGTYCEGRYVTELEMRWYNLRGDDHASARLEVFDESWTVLSQFQDVIARLAGYTKGISPREFCRLLGECGFVDRTPRKYEDSYPNS